MMPNIEIDTQRRIFEIIGRVRPTQRHMVEAPDRIVEDLGYDSVEIVELIIELENEYCIRIDDDDVAGLQTAGELACLISELIAAQQR